MSEYIETGPIRIKKAEISNVHLEKSVSENDGWEICFSFQNHFYRPIVMRYASKLGAMSDINDINEQLKWSEIAIEDAKQTNTLVKILCSDIESLYLGPYLNCKLKQQLDVQYIGELAQLSISALLCAKGIGKKTVSYIQKSLETKGLNLGMNITGLPNLMSNLRVTHEIEGL